MIYEFFSKNTSLIKTLTLELSGYIRLKDIVFLFPRFDYATDYAKWNIQFFIIILKTPISIRISQKSSTIPIISSLNKNINYSHYNIFNEIETVTVTNGVIKSFKDAFLETILKQNNISLSFLQFNSLSVKEQIRDRIKNNVPFSVWGPSVGFYELATLSNVVFTPTKFLNEIGVSLTINEIQTFSDVDFNII